MQGQQADMPILDLKAQIKQRFIVPPTRCYETKPNVSEHLNCKSCDAEAIQAAVSEQLRAVTG